MTPARPPRSGLIHTAAVVAGLAAAWSLWTFSQSLDVFAVGAFADGYRPAVLTVDALIEVPGGTLVEGKIDGHDEGIRLADLPGGSRVAAGRRLDVLIDPDLPSTSFNGHEIRVRAPEPDFARVQKERAQRAALVAYGPLAVALLALAACVRGARGRWRGPFAAPVVAIGFQSAFALVFAAIVESERLPSQGGRSSASFDAVMNLLFRGRTLPVLLVVIAAASTLIALARQRRRRLALARAASALHLSYSRSAEPPPFFAGFDLFRSKRGAFENWCQGDYGGVPLCVVDFSYFASRLGTMQTAAVFGPGAWNGPPLRLEAPREGRSAARRAALLPEIPFPEAAAFTDVYCLRAAEAHADAARAAFPSAVIDFFTERPGWWVETQESAILIYRHSETVRPEDLQGFLGRCDEVRQALGSGP